MSSAQFVQKPRNRGPAASRRDVVSAAVSLGAVYAAMMLPRAARAETPQPAGVTIENFSAAGESLGEVRVAKIAKSEDAWRRQLSAESYEVTRHAGTEAPFTGTYWNLHADGLYRCIGCDTALFDSRTKFESGTGWPSFYRPISRDNTVEREDDSIGMRRTAVSCRRCDAHLGHVFDDGPAPTGLRYCMNSAALKFVART